MEIKSGEEVGRENPLRLFELSGAVVSSIMGQVEKEVWGKMEKGLSRISLLVVTHSQTDLCYEMENLLPN